MADTKKTIISKLCFHLIMYSFRISTISSLSMFGFCRTLINSKTVNLGRLVSRDSSNCLEGLPDPEVLNSFSNSQMSSCANPNSSATFVKSPFFVLSGRLSSRFQTFHKRPVKPILVFSGTQNCKKGKIRSNNKT